MPNCAEQTLKCGAGIRRLYSRVHAVYQQTIQYVLHVFNFQVGGFLVDAAKLKQYVILLAILKLMMKSTYW